MKTVTWMGVYFGACAAIGYSVANALIIVACTRITRWRQRRAARRAEVERGDLYWINHGDRA
jgi:hypothetical protein